MPPKNLEEIIKKYDDIKDDIIKFKGEILKIYQLYTDIKNDPFAPSNPEDLQIMMRDYAKADKYNKFYSHYPPLFYTIMMSRVFDIRAAIKYLNEYHEGEPINNKDRYLEVCKVYFVNFKRSLLRSKDIDKNQFVMFYMDEMERLFNHIQNSMKIRKEKEEQLEEQQKINKRKHLKRLIAKIDLDKIEKMGYEKPQ